MEYSTIREELGLTGLHQQRNTKSLFFGAEKQTENFPCEQVISTMETNMPAFLRGLEVLFQNYSHNRCQHVLLQLILT